MKLFRIVMDILSKDKLVRPIDKAIQDHKDMLQKWDHKQRKEIIAAILNWEYPNHHLHSNPRKEK